MDHHPQKLICNLGWISPFAGFVSERACPVVPLLPTAALGAPATVPRLTEGAGKALIGGHEPLLRNGAALVAFRMSLGFTTPALLAALATTVPAPRTAKAGNAVREG